MTHIITSKQNYTDILIDKLPVSRRRNLYRNVIFSELPEPLYKMLYKQTASKIVYFRSFGNRQTLYIEVI